MDSRHLTVVHGRDRAAEARPGGHKHPVRPRTPAVAKPAVAPAPPPPEPSFMRDSYASTAFAEVIDRSVHAATARFTAGLSPMAMIGAYMDWASHLAFAPGKQLRLGEKAVKKSLRLANYASRRALGTDGAEPCIVPLPQDHRFDDPAWQSPPYDLIYQSFLLTQQWWHNAMTGVRGVTHQNENLVSFATRQLLDVFSPSNSVFTNPVLLERTRTEAGMNFVRGVQNLVEDWDRALGGGKPVGAEAYEPGRNGRDHAGQGRLSQPPDRTDPVRADDRQGPARAGADRAGVDHEVLHPRPESRELAGEVPRRPWPHRVHGLVEEPRPRGPRSVDGGLPDARRRGGAGCGVRDRPRHPHPRGGVLPRRDAAGDRRGGDGPRRRCALRLVELLRGAGRLHRGGRADAVHQREPAVVPRGHDVGAGLPRHQADGRGFPDAALERPRVVEGDPQLPDGRAAADDRPHGVERRRDPDAVPDAHRVSAPAVPGQRPGRRTLPGGRRQGRADRHPRAAVRRGHRSRPRRAVAIGVQVPAPHVGRRHLPADQRGAQCRHRVGAGASAAPLSRRQQADRRSLPRSGRVARRSVDEGGVVVARVGRVARCAFGRAGRAAGDGRGGQGYRPLGEAPGSYVRQA